MTPIRQLQGAKYRLVEVCIVSRAEQHLFLIGSRSFHIAPFRSKSVQPMINCRLQTLPMQENRAPRKTCITCTGALWLVF